MMIIIISTATTNNSDITNKYSRVCRVEGDVVSCDVAMTTRCTERTVENHLLISKARVESGRYHAVERVSEKLKRKLI